MNLVLIKFGVIPPPLGFSVNFQLNFTFFNHLIGILWRYKNWILYNGEGSWWWHLMEQIRNKLTTLLIAIIFLAICGWISPQHYRDPSWRILDVNYNLIDTTFRFRFRKNWFFIHKLIIPKIIYWNAILWIIFSV
jgi:hypothetical protein